MRLRKATLSDAKIIYEWANDPVTRKNSFSHEEIKWDDHIAWYTKKLSDSNCLFFILEDGQIPAGSIRLDCVPGPNEAIISYNISPAFRGRGLGKTILMLIEEKVLQDYRFDLNIKKLVGEVLPDNEASKKCFEHNGYTCISSDSSALIFEKSI